MIVDHRVSSYPQCIAVLAHHVPGHGDGFALLRDVDRLPGADAGIRQREAVDGEGGVGAGCGGLAALSQRNQARAAAAAATSKAISHLISVSSTANVLCPAPYHSAEQGTFVGWLMMLLVA